MRYHVPQSGELRYAAMTPVSRLWSIPALAMSVVAALLLAVPGVAHAGGESTCLGLEATIEGATSGNDVRKGTLGDDVIIGLNGKDVIYGYGGNDIICAGGGRDKVYGGEGDNIIFGQGGDDTLKGENGNDLLKGGNGNDKLYGNGGSDVAKGHKGADVCKAENEYNCEMDYRGPRPRRSGRASSSCTSPQSKSITPSPLSTASPTATPSSLAPRARRLCSSSVSSSTTRRIGRSERPTPVSPARPPPTLRPTSPPPSTSGTAAAGHRGPGAPPKPLLQQQRLRLWVLWVGKGTCWVWLTRWR